MHLRAAGAERAVLQTRPLARLGALLRSLQSVNLLRALGGSTVKSSWFLSLSFCLSRYQKVSLLQTFDGSTCNKLPLDVFDSLRLCNRLQTFGGPVGQHRASSSSVLFFVGVFLAALTERSADFGGGGVASKDSM